MEQCSHSSAGDDDNDNDNNVGQTAAPIQRSVYMICSESQFGNLTKLQPRGETIPMCSASIC